MADTGNYRIRRISAGVINTFAGADVKDGVQATSAYLNSPEAIVLAPTGEVIVSDTYNQRIRKLDLNGVVSTIAGTGIRGSSSGRIDTPQGLAYDSAGVLYFCDSGNDRILRVSGGNVGTYAGGRPGFAGDGGLGTAAQYRAPGDIAIDSAGNIYIADTGNLRVRKIDAKNGNISTIGGTGRSGASGVGGPARAAAMTPVGIGVDAGGNVYVADSPNNRILRIDATSGIASLAAGTGAAGFSGDGGLATAAQLSGPVCVHSDPAGNLYICDLGNGVVRKVTPSGTISTIAGSGLFQFDRDTGPALAAALAPSDLVLAPNGQIYIADAVNNRIRKLTVQTASSLALAGGNNQKGDPGATLNVSVRVVDSGGVPVAGATVSFSVTSGSATIATPTLTTGVDGVAIAAVKLGTTAGPVVVTASVAGLSSVTFNLTVNQVSTVPLPQIASGGVSSAGLSVPAQRSAATNGIVSVFGVNFAPAGTALRVGGADLVNGKVPTAFGGVCVEVDTVRAPIFGVYATQVNFQMPAVAPNPAAKVQLISGCGTPAELRSNFETIAVAANAPEFFYFKNNADGKNPVAAVDAVTGASLAAADLYAGGGFTPAQPNELVSIYATSFGPTSPSFAPGEIFGALANVTDPFKITLGGNPIPAENILYVGAAPALPGLYQINFKVPSDAPDGDLPISLSIGAASTGTGPFLTVKSSAN